MKEEWQEYLTKAKEWHAQLETRERQMVNAGGAALIFAIIYFGIWSPFLSRVNHLRETITSDQKTLVWMQDADKKIKALAAEGGGATSQNNTPVAVLASLQSLVEQAGMKEAVTALKQTSNDAIDLQFKNVSFDQLVKLMMNVLKENHVTISQFNAVQAASSGMVSAQVSFSLSS